jgi:hypothetical protein
MPTTTDFQFDVFLSHSSKDNEGVRLSFRSICACTSEQKKKSAKKALFPRAQQVTAKSDPT